MDGGAISGTVFEHLPPPKASVLLGWTLRSADPATGDVEIDFEAKPEFANPRGFIQGGILAAMLDDTMGPAVFVRTRGQLFPVTIDLHAQYLKPVKAGRLSAKARVVRLGKTVAFMEGELFDGDGDVVVKATASASLFRTRPEAD
ncbi:MAG TPA: PaaI family thioesterase [Caulobacteraceae bacterium]